MQPTGLVSRWMTERLMLESESVLTYNKSYKLAKISHPSSKRMKQQRREV